MHHGCTTSSLHRTTSITRTTRKKGVPTKLEKNRTGRTRRRTKAGKLLGLRQLGRKIEETKDRLNRAAALAAGLAEVGTLSRLEEATQPRSRGSSAPGRRKRSGRITQNLAFDRSRHTDIPGCVYLPSTPQHRRPSWPTHSSLA